MSASKAALEKALSVLAAGAPKLPLRLLQEFSDLDPASLRTMMEAWPGIPVQQKRLLLDGLRDLSEENTLVSFDDLARRLLTDPEGQVRTRAIRLLDENNDPRLTPAFLKILASDDDPEARREAASALGRFVELGELEEISAEVQHQVEDALLERANGDDQAAIRRRALESLGYSSRLEVVTLIESAFHRESPDWQASALRAMGRSSDDRWEDQVLARLTDVNPAVRLAAVQAAGELRLASARTLLFNVLEEEDEDEISSAAIWSLSQLGGEDAHLYVQNLLDLAEEDDDVEFLEQALENLEFTDELNRFDLMAVDSDEPES
jgi:HEAT repeat protein